VTFVFTSFLLDFASEFVNFHFCPPFLNEKKQEMRRLKLPDHSCLRTDMLYDSLLNDVTDIKRARRRKVTCTLYFLTPYKLKQRVLSVPKLHKIQ